MLPTGWHAYLKHGQPKVLSNAYVQEVSARLGIDKEGIAQEYMHAPQGDPGLQGVGDGAARCQDLQHLIGHHRLACTSSQVSSTPHKGKQAAAGHSH